MGEDYDFRHRTVSGESGDVTNETVKSWLAGYVEIRKPQHFKGMPVWYWMDGEILNSVPGRINNNSRLRSSQWRGG